jgi:hypothetical protein
MIEHDVQDIAFMAVRLQKHLENRSTGMDLAYPVKCKNGTTFSIQVSPRHHCIPRDGVGPWSHVEISPWADRDARLDDEAPFDGFSIYPYVPISVAAKMLLDHGGMK